MKAKERERNERTIKDTLREILGSHLISVDFLYNRGRKNILVTYEDFKPFLEVQSLILKSLQGKWNLTLIRNYSNEQIKNTLFEVYSENRVAVVDMVNGELKPYTIRNYIHDLMAKKQ